jgi:hypothetical protein
MLFELPEFPKSARCGPSPVLLLGHSNVGFTLQCGTSLDDAIDGRAADAERRVALNVQQRPLSSTYPHKRATTVGKSAN